MGGFLSTDESNAPERTRWRVDQFNVDYVDKGDLETVCAIYKSIATQGSNIDPEQVELWFYFNRCAASQGVVIKSDRVAGKCCTDPSVDELYSGFEVEFTTRDEQRNRCPFITSLSVRVKKDENGLADLPLQGIGNLERLRCIKLDRVRNLPHSELSRLPNLKSLYIFHLSESLCNSPLQMNLRHLEVLILNYCHLSSTLPLFPWIAGNMPKLKVLGFRSVSCNSVAFCLDNHSMPLLPSLRSIRLTDCAVDEVQLESLLFEVLPRCPALFQLSLGKNKIRSFRSIARRLRNGNARVIKHSQLRLVSLTHNPVELSIISGAERWIFPEVIVDSPYEETEAVCEFLRSFSGIRAFPHRWGSDHQYYREIEVELLLNRAGRSLVDVRKGNHLPLSMWPRILERANHITFEEDAGATSLFYLLRNGPVFCGLTQSRKRKSMANTEHDGIEQLQ